MEPLRLGVRFDKIRVDWDAHGAAQQASPYHQGIGEHFGKGALDVPCADSKIPVARGAHARAQQDLATKPFARPFHGRAKLAEPCRARCSRDSPVLHRSARLRSRNLKIIGSP
jgi:hypothetical protein